MSKWRKASLRIVTEFSVGRWGSSDKNCTQKCSRSVIVVNRILEGLHCVGLAALWHHQMKTALIEKVSKW
jgi:hypothetical protein